MTTPKNDNNNVSHLPTVSQKDVETRAREIAEEQLAQRRAKELLKEAKSEGDDLLDRATDVVQDKVTNGLNALRSWKKDRLEAREIRVTRERAQEIAREELIKAHMDEARRQLEEERQAEEDEQETAS